VNHIPPFMGDFADEDVAWVIRSGTLRHVPAGEAILEEGQELDAVFVILEGSFVASSQRPGVAVRRLGRGEIAGKTAYINRQPAVAILRAEVDSVVLSIPRAALDGKLAEDAEFARRFHRVIAELAAERPEGEGEPAPKKLADLRVHELIERMLRGDFT